jgi:hypothetical protein
VEKREKGKGWEKGLRIEGGIIDKEGKRARVAKGVRFKGGQREGLRVGKRERVSVMVGKKGRTLIVTLFPTLNPCPLPPFLFSHP